MREIQWAQVTVSKQYREHAFRETAVTTMDGGLNQREYRPMQRSLFVRPSAQRIQGKGASASRET